MRRPSRVRKEEHMKQLLALIAALLMACGGVDEDFDAPEDTGSVAEQEDAPESDIGELEQALLVKNGYGFDNVVNRCGSSGTCNIPARKSMIIRLPSTCNAQYAGQASIAANLWKDMLSTLGWNLIIVSSGQANLVLSCRGPFPGASAVALGGTSISTTPPPFGNYSCSGRYCKYENAESALYESRILLLTTFPTQGLQLQNIFLRSLWLHEIGHFLGLGHASCSVSPLMANCIRSGSTAVAFPTQAELDMLRDYAP